jgi:hypothetical protein
MAFKNLFQPFALSVFSRVTVLSTLVLSGCAGSASAGAKADTNTGADANAEANFDPDGDRAWDIVDESQNEEQTSATGTPSKSDAQDAALSGGRILIGARHDVSPKPGAPTPCQCLSVVLGQPNNPLIVWKKGPPKTDPDEQLVLALSSQGIACPEQGPGASYMGHVEEGPNIIVTVELIAQGVPVTEGAILPVPGEGGQVYIQPDGNIPYGKSLDGKKRCAVGNGK